MICSIAKLIPGKYQCDAFLGQIAANNSTMGISNYFFLAAPSRESLSLAANK